MRIARGTVLLVATTNAGKLQEIQAMLAGVPLELRKLSSDDDAPEETGETFEENARLKARYYASASGLLTVAEDSGLEIDALDGAPGVRSARYPGRTYDERFHNLFAELSAHGATDPSRRTARFVSTLALATPRAAGGDDILFEARGTVEGLIAPAPKGSGGFGYDPIFWYPPYGRTLAEVSDVDKDRVSHRGASFSKLRAFLERHIE